VSRPIRASINAPALRHNYAVAKRIAPGSKVYAVVKANAYGHGLERTARALKARADGFGILEIEGAVALRDMGCAQPILLLEGFFEPGELAVLAGHRLATAVHCDEQIRMLERSSPAEPLDVYFKVNTGMNRLGFPVEQARGALARLRDCRSVKSITLMTHFATSELADGVSDAMRRFEEATKGIDLPRSPRQLGRHLFTSGNACRSRTPGNRPLRGDALCRPQRRADGRAAGDDAFLAAHCHPGARGRRRRGVRAHFPEQEPHAHRRGRPVVRRRVSAPCALGNAGDGRWRHHEDGRARFHGHDHRGPHARAASESRLRGRAWGDGVPIDDVAEWRRDRWVTS
jgi:hypothetical protein